MNCPACTSDESTVMSTRPTPDRVVRLRCCKACGHRFHTTEMTSQALTTMNQAVEAVRSFTAISRELDATATHG